MHFRHMTENLRLNFDHVIAVDFTPAEFVEADAEEDAITRSAVLRVVTNQLIAHEVINHQNAVVAVIPCSKIYSFFGEEAEKMWGVLKNIDRWE